MAVLLPHRAFLTEDRLTTTLGTAEPLGVSPPEAVDLFLIKRDPRRMAAAFSKIPFTTAYPRLVRIGDMLVGEEVRHEFIARLLDADPMKAAIVSRARPACYTTEARARIAGELGA